MGDITQDSAGATYFKMKIGGLSVEYRGDQSFLIDDLSRVVQELLDAAPEDAIAFQQTSEGVSDAGDAQPIQHMSTNTIAGNLGAKSGPDLVMAAIGHIQLVAGKDRASRGEILSEMKKATTYYKSTFGSNLSSYLNSLVRARRVNLVAENMYALTAPERTTFQNIMSPN